MLGLSNVLRRSFAASVVIAALVLLAINGAAQAYEYPLQFMPNPGSQNLMVAGYQIVGKTIVGNCSYRVAHAGSGRDPRTTYTYYNQTCTWDEYGNLLSIAAGAPTAPTPVATNGTETIYARKSASLYTGSDTALRPSGFVFKKSPHYDWVTSNAYLVLPQQTPISFTTTITSDGENPLKIAKVRASAKLSAVTVDSTTCTGAKIAVGATCDVNVTFDPSKLASATGLAYDTLTIQLVSNSGQDIDFVQSYTISVRIPND